MSLASECAVRRSITVDVSQARAFDVFVNMTAWWPLATHTVGEVPAQASIVEPRAGGRWFTIDKFGDEDEFGRVLAYERPRRLVITWEIGHGFPNDPSVQTEIEVRFVAEAPQRTRIELEHRGFEAFGARSVAERALYGSADAWTFVLGAYANSAPTSPESKR